MIEKNQKIKWLVLLCLPLLVVVTSWQTAQMATTPAAADKVLVVYDSKNAEVAGDRKLASLQRMLSSLGLASKVVRARNYQPGQLNDSQYRGTVALINWPDAKLTSQEYLKDLRSFPGVRIQVGGQLAASQLKEMNVHQKNIFQQQLTLKMGSSSQQLPFVSSLSVLTEVPENAQKFGSLQPQSDQQQSFPFGVSVGKQAYLPFFTDSGLVVEQIMTMLSQLFNRTAANRPLLTITGIDPYTNLKALDYLTKKLHAQGYSFALSISTTTQGTRTQSFYKYAAALNRAERRGGLIFMHVPYVRQLNTLSKRSLVDTMQDSVVSLGQAGVYPVGYSSPQFWQGNQFLQKNGTKAADTVILLPDPGRQKLAEIMQGQRTDQQTGKYKQAFFSTSQTNIRTVEDQAQIKFSAPTALTVKMPVNKKGVSQLVRNIGQLDLEWYDPIKEHLEAEIDLGSVKLAYQAGNYFVNGRQVHVQDKQTQRLTAQHADSPKNQLDRFFELGSSVLIVVFVIVLLILTILLLVGRKVYRDMFVRK